MVGTDLAWEGLGGHSCFPTGLGCSAGLVPAAPHLLLAWNC